MLRGNRTRRGWPLPLPPPPSLFLYAAALIPTKALCMHMYLTQYLRVFFPRTWGLGCEIPSQREESERPGLAHICAMPWSIWRANKYASSIAFCTSACVGSGGSEAASWDRSGRRGRAAAEGRAEAPLPPGSTRASGWGKRYCCRDLLCILLREVLLE
jgi:hypothetical protein